MSVIVMGMEIPRVCIREDGGRSCCPMDRIWCAQQFAPERTTMGQIADEQNGKLPSWCPLSPLPEKHGRLIDADDYAAEMKKRQDNAMLWKEKAARYNDMITFARGDQAMRTFSEAKLTLDNMKTIVEAEGG